MAGMAAAAYNKMGVPMVGVDYRGFGASNNTPPLPPLIGSTITEASLYQDGRRIYRHVREEMGIPAAGIILNGFSLGGAVAARIAADIAKETARRKSAGKASGGTGTGPCDRGERPGGLVLHSSIRTMTEAAAGTLPLPKPLARIFGELGGRLTGGAYNTALYLRELARYALEIPIHFRGGAGDDELSLEITRLDRIGGFKNAAIYNGTEGHQSTEPGSRQGANMTEGLEELQRMVFELSKRLFQN
ncbi:MAG: hypothetical protein LBP81_01680 [Treponema sp.]|nr:hypothetical protein [Treponema sp.]